MRSDPGWFQGEAFLTDQEVCRTFEDVAYMVTHPGTLADRAILERAQCS